MSTWDRYWREAEAGIDETEARVDDTWKKVLAALVLWELWLRRRTVSRAFRLPTVNGGWLDTSARDAIRRFRAGVLRDVTTAEKALFKDLGGTRPPLQFGPRRTPPTSGLTPQAIAQTTSSFKAHWDAMLAAFKEAETLAATPIPKAPPKPEAPTAPSAVTPEKLEVIERALQERAKQPRGVSARELEDEYEVSEDAITNIARNLGYELKRVAETAVRLTGRFSRPEDIAYYMDGHASPRKPTDQPWQFNRNNLKLSTTAHIRAAHRRRMISEAQSEGVVLFRLDVPKDRLKDLTPTSILGSQLWQIRTLEEWQDIASNLNRGRVAASGFDTLGLFYNDFSYVVPVPAIFLADAQRQARRFRSRLKAGVIGAALLAREAAA